MDLSEYAKHEAGHATAAIAFAIPIIRVTIADDRPLLHRESIIRRTRTSAWSASSPFA